MTFLKNVQYKKSLNAIESRNSAFGQITFTERAPLLLSNGPSQTLSVWKLFGIYLIVEKNLENWNRPLSEFDGDLLYVGKTSSNVHDRIKSHFGLANMQSTFENHRWTTVKQVPDDLQIRLSVGDVVLYCVEVNSNTADIPEQRRVLLPEIVEKQLLLDYAFNKGALPILNLQF